MFVNHGEDMVCDAFADTVHTKLSIAAVAPYSGDEYDLVSGQCIEHGKVVKVSKVSDGRRRANQVYERVADAGKRLMSVIALSRGLSNGELAKFADQINDLCDKYIRKSGNK